jgi:preprotein translocase subunit SecG
MDTIYTVVLVVHTLIAVLLIALVLLQRGKGAEAGAAFGSGASGTVFGARGAASFLTRSTAFLATAFFCTSLALAFFANQSGGGDSVISVTAPANDLSDLAPPQEDSDMPALPDEEAAEDTGQN